jgi:HEAT repeat protein
VLRSERPPADLVIGALKALGRAHDREAVLLMLRYAQDEAPAVAQAAIAALTELGDGSIAPMLVRITQQPSADHALRLQAVGALLRIGGASYRPLLRTYLNQGALPYRLLALEQLIDAGTPADELLELLVSPGWPQALRLRLLDHFAGAAAAAPTLARILTAEDDDLQLRALAAEALGRLRWEQAGPTLIGLALRAQTPAALRQRCIAALHAIGGTDAWGAISRLAEDVAQPAEVRDSALRALRHADADESLR